MAALKKGWSQLKEHHRGSHSQSCSLFGVMLWSLINTGRSVNPNRSVAQINYIQAVEFISLELLSFSALLVSHFLWPHCSQNNSLLLHWWNPTQSITCLWSGRNNEAQPGKGVSHSSAARCVLPWCVFAKVKAKSNLVGETQFVHTYMKHE